MRQRLLDAADERIEFGGGLSIAIVVDTTEAQEQRDGWAQLGQEVAQPGLVTLVDRRKQPGPDDCS